MPKDAFTLSDAREPTLTIVCQPCGRRGRYDVERLNDRHGDAQILFLLPTLTNCPKMESANIYDRCKARYEGLTTRQRVPPARPLPQQAPRPYRLLPDWSYT
jgi:hypothetical protein